MEDTGRKLKGGEKLEIGVSFSSLSDGSIFWAKEVRPTSPGNGKFPGDSDAILFGFLAFLLFG